MERIQPRLIVTLVRHGETYLNVQRVMQGHSDSPLSDVGIGQATKLGKYLSGQVFTKAYSSDLQRAHKTAELILNEALSATTTSVTIDVKLRERCFGDAEGKPFAEFAERAAKANLSIGDFVPKGAESGEEVRIRAAEFFDVNDKLCELSDSTTTDVENVLIVSHGGWIQYLMRYLNGISKLHRVKNFSPSEAIRIHHNTGVTVMHISRISDKGDSLKYEVEFVKVNNSDHLN